MKIFLYVQHLLGIGHLARMSRIASALIARNAEVTLVTGGGPAPGFPGPDVVDHVALPAVMTDSESFTGLVDVVGQPVDEAFQNRRRDMLLAAVRSRRPDVIVIEAFPFGRRQMHFELLPLLEEAARLEPRPRLVTSIRDLLQARVKPGRNEETVRLLNEHFDLVMVHGDPAFARLDDTFPLASEIRPPIAHTGLVAGQRSLPSEEAFEVVISAGGGAAGGRLVRAAIDAARLMPRMRRWALITGPNLPKEDFTHAEKHAPAGLSLFRFRADFTSLLASTELSVSQAGYNTVCDILQAGCRSVLAPFSAGAETEQMTRAQRLAEMGLARVLAEEEMTGETLAAEIAASLTASDPPKARLNLNGARESARLLLSMKEVAPGAFVRPARALAYSSSSS